MPWQIDWYEAARGRPTLYRASFADHWGAITVSASVVPPDAQVADGMPLYRRE
jgi:hypothetical protein